MTTLNIKELYGPWATGNAWGFEIRQGAYTGAVIQVQDLNFLDGTNDLQLDFHTINIPEGMLKEDLDKPEFHDIIQLVISDIIATAIEIHKETDGN